VGDEDLVVRAQHDHTLDTEAEAFQTWLIPSGGGVVRNMMATADGNLVMACSAVNRVALVEVGND